MHANSVRLVVLFRTLLADIIVLVIISQSGTNLDVDSIK